VHYVEIDDADAEIRGTLLEDTLNHRRFCGQGALDVPAFLRAVRAQGYEGPFGIEIISEIERCRPFADVAADAIRTTRNEFAKIGK
jgi:sugar phosphate isomerase/epimerase